jgi:hypothetical protein
VAFISKFYKEKPWANHEFQAAYVRAFPKNIEYLRYRHKRREMLNATNCQDNGNGKRVYYKWIH